MHHPFLTPFSDEVLNQVVIKEAYSIVDGFSSYDQFRIAKEDKKKSWELFYYDALQPREQINVQWLWRVILIVKWESETLGLKIMHL